MVSGFMISPVLSTNEQIGCLRCFGAFRLDISKARIIYSFQLNLFVLRMCMKNVEQIFIHKSANDGFEVGCWPKGNIPSSYNQKNVQFG
jgi:hypothetical protein